MSMLPAVAGIAQGLNNASNTIMQVWAAKYKMQEDKRQADEDIKFKNKQLDLMEQKYKYEINENQSKADMLSKIMANPNSLPKNTSFSYGGLTIKSPDESMTPYQSKTIELREKEMEGNKSKDITTNEKRWKMATDRANTMVPLSFGKPTRNPTIEEIQSQLPEVDKFLGIQMPNQQPTPQMPIADYTNYQTDNAMPEDTENQEAKAIAESMYDELSKKGLSDDEIHNQIFKYLTSKGKLR